MKEGDVVIVAMPQASGSVKNRPTIILREMPPFQDMPVCGVSSQLRQEVKDFDEIISLTDNDFTSSNLTGKSLIRLGSVDISSKPDDSASEIDKTQIVLCQFIKT